MQLSNVMLNLFRALQINNDNQEYNKKEWTGHEFLPRILIKPGNQENITCVYDCNREYICFTSEPVFSVSCIQETNE